MRLDFPLDLRIDRKTVMAQFDYFPPELVSRAGALDFGIELSIYPLASKASKVSAVVVFPTRFSGTLGLKALGQSDALGV